MDFMLLYEAIRSKTIEHQHETTVTKSIKK